MSRAIAGAAWGDHVVLWPALGVTLIESADSGATIATHDAAGLQTILRPEEVTVECGPRGCTFGGQVTRLGWPSELPSRPDALGGSSPQTPAAAARKARIDASRCVDDDPVVLRCVATEARGTAPVASSNGPGTKGRGPFEHAGISDRATVGARDGLLRIFDENTGRVEVLDYAGASRTFALPGCGRGTTQASVDAEGIACFRAAKDGGATVGWYSAKTGKTGTWRVLAPKSHKGPEGPAWTAMMSPDGLAVWSGCCQSSEFWAGPWGSATGSATPSLLRASGREAAWSEQGPVSWSNEESGGIGSRTLLRMAALDPNGRAIWNIDTLAGRTGYGGRELGAWFRVQAIAGGRALRSEAGGMDGGWESVAPIDSGRVGEARRIEPASLAKPLPSCTADQRAREPLVGSSSTGGDRLRVEVRSDTGVERFRAEAQHLIGISDPCASGWTLKACDEGDEDHLLVLDGDLRSGLLIRENAGGQRRFRLTCRP